MVTIKTNIPATKPTNGSLASMATSIEAIPDFLKVSNRPTTPIPATGKTACALPAETAPKTQVAVKSPNKPVKAVALAKAKGATGKAKAKVGTKTAPKPKTAQAAPGKAARPLPAKGKDPLRIQSKTEQVGMMMRRKEGCTTAEVLALTRWPSVSLPQMARANGVRLRKEKKPGELTRYYAIVIV